MALLQHPVAYSPAGVPRMPPATRQSAYLPAIPRYLEDVYWWAYVRPTAVRLLDRTWLVNLYLCGQYNRLCDAVLQEFVPAVGKTLQVSCCYGNLTPRLFEHMSERIGTLDVVDVLPVQIENLKRKLPSKAAAALHIMDAAALRFPDDSFEQVLLFFLLHEQPQEYRERTVREALRVLKPGGTIIIVDYGTPSLWHPLRYLLVPFFGWLEPTAKNLWRRELADILPIEMAGRPWRKTSYFGGLYQVLVST